MTKKIAIIGIVFCVLIMAYPARAQDRSRELDSYFDQWNKTGRLNGSVLVAEKGRVIYKKGFGFANFEWLVPNTPDTKFKLASITKQFTAVMVFQLIQEGMIELDGKLTDYLPLYRKDTGDRVTIDHLLKHMSGIPCYIRKRLMPPSPEPRSKEEIIRDYLSGDLEFEPGSKYNYSNSGYFLLGALIEKVTGKSYPEILKERILEPLGISNTGVYSNVNITEKRASGYLKTAVGYENGPQRFPEHSLGSGNMYSTVEDMLSWIEALGSGLLLQDKHKKLILTPYHQINPGLSRTYIWNLRNIRLTKNSSPLRMMEFNGWSFDFNTGIHWFPETGNVIIVFSNRGGVDLIEIVVGTMQILNNLPYSMPKTRALDILTKKAILEGTENAFQQYKKMREEGENIYDFRYLEMDLNQAGYRLLMDGDVDESLRIFKLNVAIHPQSANAYDSLAEAYMNSGDTEKAIKNYKKSLELNPENKNAIEMLKKLEKKYQ